MTIYNDAYMALTTGKGAELHVDVMWAAILECTGLSALWDQNNIANGPRDPKGKEPHASAAPPRPF